jgi:aquaporin Z
MEGAGLGAFMVSAGVFSVLLFSSASPAEAWSAPPLVRRSLMGLAMGATAIAIVYSRWGMRSGAHLNPAVTLTFWRLGKVEPWDAVFYALAQTAGGLAGVLLVATALGAPFRAPPVAYAVTVPGPDGALPAWLGELLISFTQMAAILVFSNRPGTHRYTGVITGGLLAAYIALESPLSGTSLNPARSFASAAPAFLWGSLWIYLTAPMLGMLLAGSIHGRASRGGARCAKLHHENRQRCIFRCGYAAPPGAGED